MACAVAALWAQAAPLGVSDNEAREHFLDSIESGFPSFNTAAGKAFIALPPAARVTAVDASFAWMKAYAASPAFKSSYDKAREGRKPTPPQFKGTVDDELKKNQDDQLKGFANSRAMLASLPADQRPQLEEVLKQAEAQVKDPEMVKLMRQGIEMSRAGAQKSYQDDLAKWQQNMPVDPQVLIARRLQKFLAESADVDFTAKLVSANGRQEFADPRYQQKSGEWKMCYRAGKDAVTAARAAAQAWLKALPADK